jgi:hypothetical protein
MPNISKMTCVTEVIIAHDGDEAFLEAIKETVAESSSIESPLIHRVWEHRSDYALQQFNGILIVGYNLISKHEPRDIGRTLEFYIPKIVGTKESLLSKQKLLLCREDNISLIDSFEVCHRLPCGSLTEMEDSAVKYWSAHRENSKQRVSSVFKKGNLVS